MIETGIGAGGRVLLIVLYLNVFMGLAWWGHETVAHRVQRGSGSQSGTSWMSPASLVGLEARELHNCCTLEVQRASVLPHRFLSRNGVEMAQLDEEIRRAVIARWVPPAVRFPVEQRRATLGLVIDKEGQLLRRSLVRSSGADLLDDSILASVSQVQGFSPLPEEHEPAEYEVYLEFTME